MKFWEQLKVVASPFPLYVAAAIVGVALGMWLRHPAKLEIIKSRGGTYEVYSNQWNHAGHGGGMQAKSNRVVETDISMHGSEVGGINRVTLRSNRVVSTIDETSFRLGANAACAAMLEGVATNVAQIVERACWLQTNSGASMLW